MQAAEHLPISGPRVEDVLSTHPDQKYYEKARIFAPPCECADCQNGFYTSQEQRIDRFAYKRRISDAEAKRILGGHVAQAQEDREYLRQQCGSHGDRIMSRWRKRSRDKRQSLLLHANPDLYMHRWFIPRYVNADPLWRDARKLRQSHLLPYLSVDLLKKDPAVFLGLLYNRTHYTPDMWAPSDSKELVIPWVQGLFDVDFHDGCVVLHGSRYGQLVRWDPASAHRSDTLGYPRTQLIIEAQARLLRFLRRVVGQILEEADLKNPSGSAKWMDMVKSGSKKSGDVAYWSQFTYQPFSAPPMFNLDAIVMETKARMDAAADHVWLLQTQPSYMRCYVQSVRQYAVMKDLDSKETFQVILGELFHDIMVVVFWHAILDEFSNAKDLHRRFRDNIAPGQPLPRKCNEALGSLELLLVNSMHAQSKHLQAVIPQRPGFHNLWTFGRLSNGVVSMERKMNKSVTKPFDEDPLDWCLTQLQGAPDEQRRFDNGMLFDFLDEHLAQCSAKERARLDELLFAKLSTYAETSELLSAVRLHRPQNESRDVKQVIKTDDRLAWKYYIKVGEPLLERQRSLATLLKQFCQLGPPSGRKDAASLKHFDATYKTLQDFWRLISTSFREMPATQNLSQDDVKRVLGFLLAHESPEHVEALQAEREQILREIEASAAPPGETPFQAPSSTAAISKPEIQQRKAKVKTRPQESTTVDADTIHVPTDNVKPEEEAGSKLTVAHKRSLDVLAAMFPASAGQESSKIVDWDTFVLAMSDAGFSARNNGGSAVVFQNDRPGTLMHGGKIIFHKPHPVPKTDPVMLHSMGNRMRRWFDWRRASFVLETDQ